MPDVALLVVAAVFWLSGFLVGVLAAKLHSRMRRRSSSRYYRYYDDLPAPQPPRAAGTPSTAPVGAPSPSPPPAAVGPARPTPPAPGEIHA